MKRLLGLGLVLLAGCGDAAHSISVTVTRPSLAELDPYAGGIGLEKVRVVVDGAEYADRAVAELTTEEAEARFDGYPALEGVTVSAYGYDARGNVVAFARKDRLETSEDLSVELPLRRNLAYVTHRANPGQDRPESVVYAIDLTTRGLVSRLRLPGAAPAARSVTTRGGRSLLVTANDGGRGVVMVVSTDDHSVQTISLERPQELTLGVEASPTGVVLGGGVVSFVDLDTLEQTDTFSQPVGGQVLDAVITPDGRRALVVVDTAPGLLLVDLVGRAVSSVGAVTAPSGVALAADGRVAYVTSSDTKTVVAVDLENGRTRAYSGFVKAVNQAAYAGDIDAVLGLDPGSSGGAGRVLTFLVSSEIALGIDEAIRTSPVPVDIAMDGPGLRAMVVAAGTSTQTAGLTVVEATKTAILGASALYPTDPEDRYFDGPLELGQRYQPTDVAVLYGR